MELVLTTDLTALPPVTFNFDELKGVLNAKLEKYRNLVITDDDMKAAKADRAELNKLIASIDAERKKIKKQYLEPYDKFEAQLKEILSMIEQPCAEIDGKVKDFESRQKNAKRNSIQKFFDDNVKNLSGKVTLEKIYNPKWNTQAESLISITQEIMDIFSRVSSDITTIKTMNLKYEATVLDKLYETLNLGEALKENVRLMAIDAAEAERIAQKPIEPHTDEKQACGAITQPEQKKPTAEVYDLPTGKIYTVDIRVQGTQAQLEHLLEYLAANKIKYGEVPKKAEVA
jgi:hypothetical protein